MASSLQRAALWSPSRQLELRSCHAQANGKAAAFGPKFRSALGLDGEVKCVGWRKCGRRRSSLKAKALAGEGAGDAEVVGQGKTSESVRDALEKLKDRRADLTTEAVHRATWDLAASGTSGLNPLEKTSESAVESDKVVAEENAAPAPEAQAASSLDPVAKSSESAVESDKVVAEESAEAGAASPRAATSGGPSLTPLEKTSESSVESDRVIAEENAAPKAEAPEAQRLSPVEKSSESAVESDKVVAEEKAEPLSSPEANDPWGTSTPGKPESSSTAAPSTSPPEVDEEPVKEPSVATALSFSKKFEDPRWTNGTWDLTKFVTEGGLKVDWDSVIDAEVRRRQWLEANPEAATNDDPVLFDTNQIPWDVWMRRFHLPVAEKLNGRAAMIGFAAGYLVDAASGAGLVDQSNSGLGKLLMFLALAAILLIRRIEDVTKIKNWIEEWTTYDKQWGASRGEAPVKADKAQEN